MIGIGVVNHMHLGAANPARKARPCGAGLAQPQTGGIDQIDALAERPAQTAMRPFHQLRKQLGKHRAGPSGIGIGQGRALHRPHPQVVEPGRVAGQTGDDFAQARRARKLAVQQGHKLAFRVEPTNSRIGPVLADQAVKNIPRYVLQQLMKNAILVAHGIALPSRVRTVGKTSQTEWNQCHAPCPAKLNRTAVAWIWSS
jgi:hypothetical protein